MPPEKKPGKPTYFAKPEDFRAWLAKHHATETELLVGFHKRKTDKPSITWPESVDEALSFGWIDGVRRSLGDEAYTIRFSPRKKTSIWSVVNVARVAELTKRGRMTKAGLDAFAARTEARTAVYSFERKDEAKLSPAHEAIFRKDRRASAFFDAQPAWYRRAALHWVITAKQEATRERRFAQLLEHSVNGRTVPHLTRTTPAKR